MVRHSKNNSARGFYSNAEIDKLGPLYGKLKERVGKDSMLQPDCCRLCLQTARHPMVCNKGHLYCKECVVESVLQQRKQIERDARQAEVHNALIESDDDRIARLANEAKIAKFLSMERVSSSIDTTKEELKQPNLAPSAKLVEIKVKRETPLCHAGSKPHPLSLKKLTSVNFKVQDDATICFVCLKKFINGMGVVVIKPCGEAVCKYCYTLFISKKKSCICDVEVVGIIEIQGDGTGFTAAGKAEATKETPAFM